MPYPRNRLALSFLAMSAATLLCCLPCYGRRSVGTLDSSSYGNPGGQSTWELTSGATRSVNGISISTEAVCGGGLTNLTPKACASDTSTLAFLYQINSDAKNLVVTFSGLSRFPFITDAAGQLLGFGILLCGDAGPTDNMLCTPSPPASSSDIGWDVIGGDLILTIPSVAAADKLTFYIAEQPAASDTGALTAPTISVGGAAVVPPGLAFGSQESNAAGPPQTITVANSADFASPLNIKNISTSNNFVQTDTCSTLAPGDNCALFLGFSPTSSGNLPGSLVVTDDSPLGSEAVTLSGFGTTGGITVSPSTVVFGTQPVGTTSAPIAVTISNAKSNAQSLQVIGIVSALNPVTGLPDFQTNDCNTPVAPGSSCTLQVTFSPTISGLIQSSITLTDNSSDGSHTIELVGNGTEAKTATASPSSLDFGTQISGTTSAAKLVTVTNTSTTTSITTVAVNPTAGFARISDNCSTAALSSGKTCTVSVAFQPPAGSHSYTGSLAIANDAVGGTVVIPLTGASLSAPAATPVFSPGASTYTSIQNVMISDSTPGATIYYTIDGTTPTTGSTAYSGPIAVSTTQTINAIATAPDYAASAVASALYTINLPPSFKISGTPVAVASGATTSNASTITVTPGGSFTGSVTLTAAITSNPANAMNPPTLSFGSTSSVSITGSSAATATLTITTTPSTMSALHPVNLRGHGWVAAGGASLALMMFFGIPNCRRRWHVTLGLVLILLTVTNGMVACGGGGNSPHGGNSSQGSPGTTPGAYTITVTGTSGPLTETGTIELTVN
jgi:hypothetical protein